MFAKALMTCMAIAVTACASVPEAVPDAQSPDLWTAACTDWDEWDKPGPPYRIHGNTYYVGTGGISAILIAEPEGMILIDSGTDAGADIVLNNIRTLGFDPQNVRWLLHSHEHFDHVGGFAKIARATGAQVVVSKAAAGVINTGQDSNLDPQFGMHPPMAPVGVDLQIGDDWQVSSGATTLTAIATPGHTPGALSWAWRSCDNSGCRSIVYADSLSPVSSDAYRFSDHPAYLAAYRASLDRLAATPCDLLLSTHPSSSNMPARLRGEAPLVSSTACRDYPREIGERLDARVADEAQ